MIREAGLKWSLTHLCGPLDDRSEEESDLTEDGIDELEDQRALEEYERGKLEAMG